MKRILIISDSHKWTVELAMIREKHQDECDLMIHCGDSELSADNNAIEGFITVRGNCDFEQRFPEQAEAEIAGHKIFVTHGHLYSVKSSLMKLYYRTKETGANIVCFGHSHTLGAELVGDILFINPGSIRLPRGRKERTYCILNLSENQAELFVYDLSAGELPGLRSKFLLPKS